MASKQANGGGALVAPAAHQPLGLDQYWPDIIFLRYPLDKISIFFFFFLSDKDILQIFGKKERLAPSIIGKP
jgi:hypothetical protein